MQVTDSARLASIETTVQNIERQAPFTTKDGSTIRSILDRTNAPVKNQSLAEARGWPRDYIKCMALVESHPLAFQMEELLYNLRDHILGLNLTIRNGCCPTAIRFLPMFLFSRTCVNCCQKSVTSGECWPLVA